MRLHQLIQGVNNFLLPGLLIKRCLIIGGARQTRRLTTADHREAMSLLHRRDRRPFVGPG